MMAEIFRILKELYPTEPIAKPTMRAIYDKFKEIRLIQ